MSARTKWMRGGLAAAGVIVLGAIFVASREPHFKDRPLRAWMRDLDSPSMNKRQDARDAIRAMGPRTVPFLTNSLAQRDSIGARLFRTQSPIRKAVRYVGGLVHLESPALESYYAAKALGALGTNATQAIPVLIAALDDPLIAESATDALAHIGPPAVPALQQELINNPNPLFALSALGWMRTNALPAAPEIVTQLASIKPGVPERALLALVQIGPGSVAALTNRLGDTNPVLRARALNVLHQIGPNASIARPFVVPLLRDANPEVRYQALLTYAAMPAEREEAAPHWLEALKDSDPRNAAFAVQMLAVFPRNVHNYSNEIAAAFLRPEPAVKTAASNALTRFHSWPK